MTTFTERPEVCPICNATTQAVIATNMARYECGVWAESYDDGWHSYGQCRNAFTAAVQLRARVDELSATIARVRALLPKWGYGMANSGVLASATYGICFNDLSCALAVPETPDQAAERLADHREDERLDQMADADAQEEQAT